MLSFTPLLPFFNLINNINIFIIREIVVANPKPTIPRFNFINIKFSIIFSIFAIVVAIMGVLVSLTDLKQLDRINDKHKNTDGTTTTI